MQTCRLFPKQVKVIPCTHAPYYPQNVQILSFHMCVFFTAQVQIIFFKYVQTIFKTNTRYPLNKCKLLHEQVKTIPLTSADYHLHICTLFPENKQTIPSTSADQYVVFGHRMLCCPVGYVERGGPYLPWQGKQFRKLSAAWLPIGEAFTGCTPIGQAVIHLR